MAKHREPTTSPTPHDFSRWEAEIESFERADRREPPPKGATLFVGSSTIRLWETLAQDFLAHHVINRGFGGSDIVDATHFAERIIFPYEPRAIFLRAGGNAIAAGASPREILASFEEFVVTVHARLPQTQISYISLSASIARWHLAEQNKAASSLIEQYVRGEPHLTYIDTYDIPLGADGKPRPELFTEDRLHYNAEGYKLLAQRVRPYLPKP